MHRYQLPSLGGAQGGRVIVHCGDLALPLLGLSASSFARFSAQLHAVVHCGAEVNWVRPYATLRRTNVAAVDEVIRLCASHHPKQLLLVSTSSVAAPNSGDETSRMSLDEALAGNGYVLSKWVAEQRAERAAARFGLSVLNLRFGYVCGSSASGAAPREQFVSRFLSGIVQVPPIPSHPIPPRPLPTSTHRIHPTSTPPHPNPSGPVEAAQDPSQFHPPLRVTP